MTKAELVKNAATQRTLTFKYDPFGRRVEKKVVNNVAVNTTTWSYLYDGADIVQIKESDATSTHTTHLTHGPGIDEPLAMVRDGVAYLYHADGLGSIVAITNNTGSVVNRYSYESFGMVTATDPTFPNAYTYTGREWDKEFGLYYYRARYYDPLEGRFISKDPIGFAGGDVNLYGYVGNNGVNFIDPSGESVTVMILASIGVVTGVYETYQYAHELDQMAVYYDMLKDLQEKQEHLESLYDRADCRDYQMKSLIHNELLRNGLLQIETSKRLGLPIIKEVYGNPTRQYK